MPKLLRYGSQYGGKDAVKIVKPYDRLLKHMCAELPEKDYFKNLRILNVTWRVAGSILDFDGKVGGHHLRYWRRERFIGIDWHIPVSAWKGVGRTELVDTLIEGLTDCYMQVLDRACREGEVRDVALVRRDFADLCAEYREQAMRL